MNLILVFLVGFFASFIGVIAGGGGGLISIPALIFMGMPPTVSIATNRLGSLGLASSSLYNFSRAKKVAYEYILPLAVLSVAGSLIGAHILLEISQDLLSKLLGIMMIVLLPLTLFRVRRKKRLGLGYMSYFFVAVYTGLIGGGGGFLAVFVFVLFFDLNHIRATATNKIPVLLISAISLGIFAYHGLIEYLVGIILFFGMLMGGFLGSHTAIKKGNKFVKMVMSIMVLVFAVKLLFF